MSDTYQFAIDRRRGLALAACFIAAALLLFFAGTLTGMLLSNDRIANLTAESKVPTVKLPSTPKQPELPKPAAPEPIAVTPSAQATPEPLPIAIAPILTNPSGQANLAVNPSPAQPVITDKAEPTANSTAVKASPALVSSAAPVNPTAIATTKTAQFETSQQPAGAIASHLVQTSPAVPLAVKVGSFTVKSNADALVVSLNDLGYRPVMSQFEDTHGRQWYLVKLGPYKRWNAASAVAARVAIAENVRPIIGPMQ